MTTEQTRMDADLSLRKMAEWSMVIISLCSLIVGVIIACIYYQQLVAIRQAAQIVNASAIAAQSAYEAARRTEPTEDRMKGGQAASISMAVEPFIGDLSSIDLGIKLRFTNHGQVIATGFKAQATLVRQSLPAYADLGAPLTGTLSGDQLVSSAVSKAGNASAITFNTSEFTRADIAAIKTMHETVKVSGQASYDDGFGRTVETPFCFQYFALYNPDGSGSEGWMACDEGKAAFDGVMRRRARAHLQY